MANRFTYYTPDMSCKHCVMTIERALAAVVGITDVQVDLESKTVHLTAADDAAAERARAALSQAGYPVASQ